MVSFGPSEVLLESAGRKKIAVIKRIRKATRLGLSESKDLVDSAPSTITGLSPETAEELASELTRVGARAVVQHGKPTVTSLLAEAERIGRELEWRRSLEKSLSKNHPNHWAVSDLTSDEIDALEAELDELNEMYAALEEESFALEVERAKAGGESSSADHAAIEAGRERLDVLLHGEQVDAAASKRRPMREPIPERVRHEVWRRDMGRCVDCGSRERLEFDHIIPVIQGGSNTARNLELRCESCNRRKGATI